MSVYIALNKYTIQYYHIRKYHSLFFILFIFFSLCLIYLIIYYNFQSSNPCDLRSRAKSLRQVHDFRYAEMVSHSLFFVGFLFCSQSMRSKTDS